MIHLKYICKVNFVKLPLIWIDLCLKLIFENVTAGRNIGCRSVVNCASQVGKIMLATRTISHQVEYVTASWFRKTRFTRGRKRKLKNAHNSVIVQNRTRVYMNYFITKTQEITSCSNVHKSWNNLYSSERSLLWYNCSEYACNKWVEKQWFKKSLWGIRTGCYYRFPNYHMKILSRDFNRKWRERIRSNPGMEMRVCIRIAMIMVSE